MSGYSRIFLAKYIWLLLIFFSACGYHHPKIKVLPKAEIIDQRTLFIAFDGVSYDMMDSLIKRGYFKDFKNRAPLVVTFPSATTVGFTGIFKPLNVKKVPGYEVRFYSFEDDKIIGGTPKDIYHIHIDYKTYFDAFRFTMFEKSIMYTFPGVAGQQDLHRTRDLLYKNPKNVLISYLGGTDGSQHILGKRRTEKFLIYADKFIQKMKKEYEQKTGSSLRIVFISDHGFHFDRMKTVSNSEFKKKLEPHQYNITTHLVNEKDVVLVKFGLLSAGVIITKDSQKESVARHIHDIKGIDFVTWEMGKKIHILNFSGEEAYFEYISPKRYRYVTVSGDPLKYLPLLKQARLPKNKYLNAAQWFDLTSHAYYPDAGYRLYDGFHGLVKNKASILFSLKERYQFGSLAALAGTKLKPGGHKGTHGGMFRETSWGIVMTDDPHIKLPKAVRYDEMFPLFLKPVTDELNKNVDIYWPSEDEENHE